MLLLPESITHGNARQCLNQLQTQLASESAPEVRVDASGLKRFDSAALALLLELRRGAMQRGKTLSLQAMPARLADVARLYGIDAMLPSASPSP